MNCVTLVGRLTRDPELREGTTSVARFSVAIDRGKDKDGNDRGTDFPGIVVFGKQAESCARYLEKGRQVAIQGRIQTGSYEKDGKKIYTTDVVADRVEFLGGRQEGDPHPYDRVNKGVPAPVATLPEDVDYVLGHAYNYAPDVFHAYDDGDDSSIPF